MKIFGQDIFVNFEMKENRKSPSYFKRYSVQTGRKIIPIVLKWNIMISNKCGLVEKIILMIDEFLQEVRSINLNFTERKL